MCRRESTSAKCANESPRARAGRVREMTTSAEHAEGMGPADGSPLVQFPGSPDPTVDFLRDSLLSDFTKGLR